MSLSDFLVYLTGVGVIAVVSWLFEDWKWYQSLQGKPKQLLFFGACAVVAIGAQCVITFVNPAVLQQIAPWFATLSVLFAYIFLGTEFHAKTKLE